MAWQILLHRRYKWNRAEGFLNLPSGRKCAHIRMDLHSQQNWPQVSGSEVSKPLFHPYFLDDLLCVQLPASSAAQWNWGQWYVVHQTLTDPMLVSQRVLLSSHPWLGLSASEPLLHEVPLPAAAPGSPCGHSGDQSAQTWVLDRCRRWIQTA